MNSSVNCNPLNGLRKPSESSVTILRRLWPPQCANSRGQQDDDVDNKLEAFICGKVKHHNQQSQVAVVGVYYTEEDPKNTTLKSAPEESTNQNAELTGLLHILLSTLREQNVHNYFPNMSVPHLLLHHLQAGRDRGWPLSKNRRILSALVKEMEACLGKVFIEPETPKEEHPQVSEVRALVDRDMTMEELDGLQVATFPAQPVTGAKLITMMQSAFYHEIHIRKGKAKVWRATITNLDTTRHALYEVNREYPTDETI